MFFIYYLKLTNIGMVYKPHLHNHYVLSLKNKFFVMSSQLVKGLKSHYIHTPNINGQLRSQYVIENAHTFDPKYHIFNISEKGMKYLEIHKEKFQLVLEALQNLPQ